MLKNFIKTIKNYHDPVYAAVNQEAMNKHFVVTFVYETLSFLVMFPIFAIVAYLGMAFIPGLI